MVSEANVKQDNYGIFKFKVRKDNIAFAFRGLSPFMPYSC
jgi:hypothetical protein